VLKKEEKNSVSELYLLIKYFQANFFISGSDCTPSLPIPKLSEDDPSNQTNSINISQAASQTQRCTSAKAAVAAFPYDMPNAWREVRPGIQPSAMQRPQPSGQSNDSGF
jgi:hypothetical protein